MGADGGGGAGGPRPSAGQAPLWFSVRRKDDIQFGYTTCRAAQAGGPEPHRRGREEASEEGEEAPEGSADPSLERAGGRDGAHPEVPTPARPTRALEGPVHHPRPGRGPRQNSAGEGGEGGGGGKEGAGGKAEEH